MKIAIFTDTYTPDVNGVALTLERWAKYLSKQGHEVLVFAPESTEKGRREEQDIKVMRYFSMPFFLYPELSAAVPNPIATMQRLTDFNPDIIHCSTPFNVGLLGRIYATENDIPLVASYHTNFDQYLTAYKMDWARDLMLKYSLWFHEEARRIYVPSTDTLRDLTRQGYKDLEIWARGIELDAFRPLTERQESLKELRSRFSLSEDEFVVSYVGRIAAEKNLKQFLAVADYARRKKYDNVKFIMVGDGPMMGEIQSKVAKEGANITLLGYQDHEILPDLYAASDLFLFPSTTETFGNVVLEALACGIPVITSNSGGVVHLVENQISGFHCPGHNSESFINAFETLYHNAELRQSFGKAGRTFAEKQSWDNIFSELLDSYKMVLEEEKYLELTS